MSTADLRFVACLGAVIALALQLPGCGSDDPTGGADDATADATIDVDGTIDVAVDDGGTARDSATDEGGGEALPGDPCDVDGDCASGLCIEPVGLDERLCTSLCDSDADCPDDRTWSCVLLSLSGGDAARVCLPDGLCVDADLDGWGRGPGCEGPDCDDDDPDINPAAQEWCDGIDQDCDGLIDEAPQDVGGLCATPFDGICGDGIVVCRDGLVECEPLRTPSEESCNGVDDDCDGDVDEGADGLALIEVCYSGPFGTDGVGICEAGVRVCDAGRFTVCGNQVVPAPAESCNGVDDDCDGVVDEGNPGGGFLCNTGRPGACASGETACIDGEAACVADRLPGDVEEVCNAVDDDCDGETDEGESWLDVGTPCTVGVGACLTTGIWQCDPTDPAGPPRCSAVPRSSTPEVCNGVDDDCDGFIDEDPIWDTVGLPCTAGQGACVALGVWQCDVDHPDGEPICSAEPGPAFSEVCNGVDDDCDGEIDEGDTWAGRGSPCVAGDGICARPGVLACDPDDAAGALRCTAEPGPSSEEVCNGLDDDCDGLVDEEGDWSDVGEACLVGRGICTRAGVVTCDAADRAGPAVCSATPGPSSDEVCNGLDDDCDGQVDNLEPPLCPLQLGECAGATQICTAGGGFLACSTINYGATYEVVEVTCDGLDNDCDGEIDNVDVDGDGFIDVACGGTDCDDRNPLAAPDMMEICGDGADNDCNTVIDDLDADGDGVVSRACGGTDCNDGSELVRPGLSEVCGDGLDNDCDGSIDNRDDDGDSFLAAACGGTDCDDDNDVRFPGNPEVCDGFDNDCNEVVDDRDVDGDGFVALACGGTDCDDDDVFSNPDRVEVCGNAADEDCSGSIDDRDADGDGRIDIACGGTDCDDTWDETYPGRPELRDARDNDCDGLYDEGLLSRGDLIVTEVMYNPAGVVDTVGEWFEVYNTSSTPINLNSITVSDESSPVETFTTRVGRTGVVVGPGEWAVFCRIEDPEQNGGVTCDVGYDDFQLANGGDEIILSLDGTLLDRVAWGTAGWPNPNGASAALRSSAYTESANDSGSNWSATGSGCALSSGDSGSPGVGPDGC